MKTPRILAMAVLMLNIVAVAEAQIAKVEVLTQPKAAAREGGKREAAGDVFLNIDLSGTVAAALSSATFTYSAPLASGLEAESGGVGIDVTNAALIATDALDHAKGIIKIDAFTAQAPGGLVSIKGVQLDVSKASGPITVTVKIESGDGIAVFDGADSGTVITEILPGVKAAAKEDTIRTRGGQAEATFTLEEGFKGAFEVGQMVELEVAGLPEAVTVSFTATDPAADPDASPPVLPGQITPANGSFTGDADGDDQTQTLTLGSTDTVDERSMAAVPKVNLAMTLSTSSTDVNLPLMMGEITVRATLAGTNFENAQTASMTIFEIRPAQCILLFPLVTYIPNPDGGPDALFDTGLAVSNPAYLDEDDRVTGTAYFTFYKGGIEPVTYETGAGSPGTGLEPDGTIAPGSTYTVNASELLAAANWDSMDVGHVRVRANFTNCDGLGLIYGTMGIDQSYPARILDSDTGLESDLDRETGP